MTTTPTLAGILVDYFNGVLAELERNRWGGWTIEDGRLLHDSGRSVDIVDGSRIGAPALKRALCPNLAECPQAEEFGNAPALNAKDITDALEAIRFHALAVWLELVKA